MANEVVFRHKLHLFDPEANSNKFYDLEWYADGHLKCYNGREGVSRTEQDKGIVSRGYVDQLINEKKRKGYRDVDLHTPVAATVASPTGSGNPKVDRLIADIFIEAGEKISSYLGSTVDALSSSQIRRGRTILADIQDAARNNKGWSSIEALVTDYYNTIPTKLPRKIDKTELVGSILGPQLKGLDEQEERLDQLESALSTYAVTASGGSQFSALGIDLAPFDTGHALYGFALNLLEESLRPNHVRIKDVFALRIPAERTAYEANAYGKDKELFLFHGTRGSNVRHILKGGLAIPRSFSNGWRFGPGIYFADRAWRSYQYVESRHMPKTMFLSLVSVGKQWANNGSDPSFRQAPAGHHSVRGTGSWSNRGDEVIVYRPEQQTLLALVTLE